MKNNIIEDAHFIALFIYILCTQKEIEKFKKAPPS